MCELLFVCVGLLSTTAYLETVALLAESQCCLWQALVVLMLLFEFVLAVQFGCLELELCVAVVEL